MDTSLVLIVILVAHPSIQQCPSPQSITFREEGSANPPGIPRHHHLATPHHDSLPPKPPLIPDVFTVAVETVHVREGKRLLWRLHVDRGEKLVVHSMDEGGGGKRTEWFYSKIVREFRAGLEFRISRRRGKETDCVVEPILQESESESESGMRRFMLEHGRMLLNFDPSLLSYWGERPLRSLPSPTWLHESKSNRTTEFGFSKDDKDSSLPISIATFSIGTSPPELVAVSNLYREIDGGGGSVDVRECLELEGLMLRVVLDVPATKLIVGGNKDQPLESIRRAIAGLAGLSLVRVNDLAITDWPEKSTAFWFSLREIVHSAQGAERLGKNAVTPLADGFRVLRDVVQRHEVTVRVEVEGGVVLVPIRRGSLVSIPRTLHPLFGRSGAAAGGRGTVVRAAYTSGAVAGLGLAMAILGLSVGLLLGFLLWNDSTRVRYWRSYPYGVGG